MFFFLFRSGNFRFSTCFFFFSTLEPEMMNIVQLIIKNAGRSPRDQANGGEGWVRAGGNCQEEMLCRSMKNCTGILPPQLTVWEADLISGESIWLELWEITLPKITSVTAVGTLSSQGDLYLEIITLPTLELSRFFKEPFIKQRL